MEGRRTRPNRYDLAPASEANQLAAVFAAVSWLLVVDQMPFTLPRRR